MRKVYKLWLFFKVKMSEYTRTYQEKAENACKSGNFLEAEEIYEEGILSSAEFDDKKNLSMHYAHNLIERGKFEKAKEYIDKVLEFGPFDEVTDQETLKQNYISQNLLHLRAKAENGLGDHETALNDFEFILNLHHLHKKVERSVNRNKAKSLIKLNRNKEAITELDKVIAQYEKGETVNGEIINAFPEALYLRAQANFNLKNIEEALHDIELSLDPFDKVDPSSKMVSAGELTRKQGIKEKLSVLPKYKFIHKHLILRGEILYAQKNKEFAHLDLDCAIHFIDEHKNNPLYDINELREDYIKANMTKGEFYYQEGNFKEASTNFLKAFQAKNEEEILVRLVDANVKAKDVCKLLKNIEYVRKIEENKSKYYEGLIYLTQGFQNNSLEELEKAVKEFNEVDFEKIRAAQVYKNLSRLAVEGKKQEIIDELITAKNEAQKIKVDERTKDDYEALILSTYCLNFFKKDEKVDVKGVGSYAKFKKDAIEKNILNEAEIEYLFTLVPLEFKRK